MNVKALRRIQKFLLAEPRRYDMSEGIFSADNEQKNKCVLKAPPCGTMCCIAGAAYLLSKKIDPKRVKIFENGGVVVDVSTSWHDIEAVAREFLGLGELDATRLFFDGKNAIDYWHPSTHWPDKFVEQYQKAKTPAGRVRAGLRRIEHFIKTKGAE